MNVHRWDKTDALATSLTIVIDVEENFIFSPYQATPGVLTFDFFIDKEDSYSISEVVSVEGFNKP